MSAKIVDPPIILGSQVGNPEKWPDAKPGSIQFIKHDDDYELDWTDFFDKMAAVGLCVGFIFVGLFLGKFIY